MAGYSLLNHGPGVQPGNRNTIQESLADLGIDTLINPSEINQTSPGADMLILALQEDAENIAGWIKKK